jgi:lysophospholipase
LPKSETRSRATTPTTTLYVPIPVDGSLLTIQISAFDTLTLVDAGLTNQNIPIEPLLIPQRNVDAIIAVDASADTTYSFPNGSALRTTFERAAILEQNQDVRIRMPTVPSVNGFINGGLNTRPTFFGCNDTDTPIIVYVPNYPWSYASNTSTYKLDYTKDEAHGVVNSGMRSLTLNGTVEDWPKCLACALSDRSFGYTAENRTSECQQCFATWCWNGVDDDSEPSGDYEPAVGSVPQFLSSNNLATSPSNAPAASSPAASQSSQAANGASRALVGGWSMAAGAVGVLAGGLAVML